MKYISNFLVACAVATASVPAAAGTVTLDFESAPFAGYPTVLATAYGNGNAAADFTWTGVEVYDTGATSTPNKTIYSGSGNVLIAAVGGQTISQVAFDYFTYYDSAITTSPTTNAWSLLDGAGNVLFSGTMNAIGGSLNTPKPVQSFVQDLTPGLYSTLKLTFSNDTAMGFDNFSVTAGPVEAVPLPGSLGLLGAGLAALGFARRRRAS
jgi:hypothetical protein